MQIANCKVLPDGSPFGGVCLPVWAFMRPGTPCDEQRSRLGIAPLHLMTGLAGLTGHARLADGNFLSLSKSGNEIWVRNSFIINSKSIITLFVIAGSGLPALCFHYSLHQSFPYPFHHRINREFVLGERYILSGT